MLYLQEVVIFYLGNYHKIKYIFINDNHKILNKENIVQYKHEHNIINLEVIEILKVIKSLKHNF